VVGAGGFAREVRWLISEIDKHQDNKRFEFAGFLVSDRSKIGPHDSVDEIVGELDYPLTHPGKVDALAMGIGAPDARRRLGLELSKSMPNIEWPSLVHPSVHMDHGSCVVEPGAVICAGVVATVGVHVFGFAAVNLLCTLGHECKIGVGTNVSPSVNVSGAVIIEDGALIGTGAQILQYIRVGEGAQVGAGAVVTKDVPPGVTVVGNPASPLAEVIKQRRWLKRLAEREAE
jgi:sugar O-acyltransferase (sialic acid O-acetyltransferase NeuD family)